MDRSNIFCWNEIYIRHSVSTLLFFHSFVYSFALSSSGIWSRCRCQFCLWPFYKYIVYLVFYELLFVCGYGGYVIRSFVSRILFMCVIICYLRLMPLPHYVRSVSLSEMRTIRSVYVSKCDKTTRQNSKRAIPEWEKVDDASAAAT